MKKVGHRDYGGAVDFDELSQNACGLIGHIRKLREAIGPKNRRLLDDYLCSLLEVISDMSDTFNTAERGNQADQEFHNLYSRIVHEEEAAKQHLLYGAIKARIDAYPEQPNDAAQTEAIYMEVFQAFAEHSLEGFLKECDDSYDELSVKFDLPDTREALAQVAGNEEIDKLDILVLSFFYSVSPSRVYLQAMLDQLVLSLLTRDRLSGEYAFQRLLNHVG